MVLILAAPLAPPVPAAPAKQPRFMQWTGWDGSRWLLSDPVGSPAMLPGVEGLHEPKYTRFTDQASAVPGNRIRGVHAQERTVFWPLQFQAESVDDWRDTYSAFFDSIDPERPGVWQVDEGQNARILRLTGVFDDGYQFDMDPFISGWAAVGVKLEAAQPFWEGVPVTRGPWQAVAGGSFFPGPPFHLTDGHADPATAVFPNPGQVPAYLTWALAGPLDAGAQVGVAGRIITVPFAVLAGKTLVVQTDPRVQFATLVDGPVDWSNITGTDMTADLGFQDFGPVPPGGEVPLTIAIAGGGVVNASLTPLYRRAF